MVRLEPDALERGLEGARDLDDPLGVGNIKDLENVFARFTDRRASYMNALHETKRRMGLLRALGARHPYWDVNSKQGGYRFAAAHGISHPETIARYASLDEIDLADLPSRFLLKPDSGSNNRGIMGLDRQDDGTYIDRLLGRVMTWEDVRAEYSDHADNGRISKSVMVEELLCKPGDSNSITDDFKVYCFYDRAELIMQRDMSQSQDRSQWKFKFWNRDWEDVGPVKYADRCHPELERPPHAEEIIAEAERLGKALRQPFIRLDFYDSDRGVVFGEVTLTPGPPEVFAPEVDEYLGRHREYAVARLMAEDIAAGHFDHLKPPRGDAQADS
ncbi:MAG: hypothetical protein ACI9C1_001687 [Candidatus Aldehydirespiratoraceae bacterium]|jgi:hypothetical protein